MTFLDLLRCRVRVRWLFVRVLALLVPLVAVNGNSLAGQVKLAWDPVASATGYRLHYGTSSGNYASSIDAKNQTNVTVPGLTDGARYYFAVAAYNSTTTSALSSELSAVVPAPSTPPPATPPPSAPPSSTVPAASFIASPMTGAAPLVVTLIDRSSGVTTRSWQLGDGTTATTQIVVKTYSKPGIYTVTLRVTGSGGSSTATRAINVAAAPVPGSPPPPTGTPPAPPPAPPTGGTGGSGTTGGTAPHANGLVAAYGFEERSGPGVIDASGNANHGMISGARRVTTTFFGRALWFDGKDDWVTIDDSASLDLVKGMTLEAWIYPTARLSGWTTVVLKERSGGRAYSLYANSDMAKPSSTINAGGADGGADRQLSAGPQPPVNTWTHLAATYDGSTQRLYLNGQLVATRPQAGNMLVSGGKLRIGGNSIWDDQYFTGFIDEVRVYNRALTQAEIVVDSKTAVVGLVLSKSPDRSDAVPLNGLSVSGTIYVYYAQINPEAASNPVKQVAFWLDDPNPTRPSGTPRRTELQTPFDFGGTGGSNRAVGFDTTGLSKGIHTITARVTMRDGTVLPVINGTFLIK